MAPKLLLTGTTGYIGGTVLDTIVKAHPEYEVTVILRRVPDDFISLYPNVHIVKGDYDSSDIIADAASKADVVVHSGDSDHEPSIKALIAGLLRRSERSFLIHLSGTGIVSDWLSPKYLGTLNPKIWSDIDDLDEITSRPDPELHRNVDKIIQQAADEHGDKLKTAIMCPPDIYGPGRGPGKKYSVYFPVYFNEIKKVEAPFYAGDGKNTRSWVHIDDLMTVYLKLVESAVADGRGADWGKEGYYFAATQEASQIEVAHAVGKILKKHDLTKTAVPKQVPLETVSNLASNLGISGIGTYLFASNSRTRAHRAAKLFGYQGAAPSLWDSIEADILASAE